jgi:hypothetical protein
MHCGDETAEHVVPGTTDTTPAAAAAAATTPTGMSPVMPASPGAASDHNGPGVTASADDGVCHGPSASDADPVAMALAAAAASAEAATAAATGTPMPAATPTSTSTTAAVPAVRRRHWISYEQKSVLMHIYVHNQFPSTREREALGARLNMTPRSVQIWFQNQRQRAMFKRRRDAQLQSAAAAAATTAVVPTSTPASASRPQAAAGVASMPSATASRTTSAAEGADDSQVPLLADAAAVRLLELSNLSSQQQQLPTTPALRLPYIVKPAPEWSMYTAASPMYVAHPSRQGPSPLQFLPAEATSSDAASVRAWYTPVPLTAGAMTSAPAVYMVMGPNGAPVLVSPSTHAFFATLQQNAVAMQTSPGN